MNPSPSQESAPAAKARIVVERPPPGLAQGGYAWPAWAIGALGVVVVAAALAYMIWRWRKLRSS